MARYVATVETDRAPGETFAYLSDFSTTREWDPGVVEADRLDHGPIDTGSAFRVVARFLGRETALTYRVEAIEPGRSITVRGENATVVSLDTMTFTPLDGGGTRVTYDADLALKGPLALGDPLLGLAFDRIGDAALSGLRARLGERAPGRLPELEARSLNGLVHRIPGDLTAPFTFLVAAFRREQQAEVDTWLPWLLARAGEDDDVDVYELPVLATRWSPARGFIDGGMARGVGGDEARARTLTVYTNVDAAVRGLGLPGTDTIGVLLADRTGRVLARETGPFDEAAAHRLAGVLRA